MSEPIEENGAARDGRAAGPTPSRALTPAAQRALAEALARRAALDEKAASMPKELGGRFVREPVRYGDWEVKGIASDF